MSYKHRCVSKIASKEVLRWIKFFINTNLQKTSLPKLVDPFSVVLVCHVDIGQYASSGQYKAKLLSTTCVIVCVFI